MTKLRFAKRFLFTGFFFAATAMLLSGCEEPNEPEDPNEVYYKAEKMNYEKD